MNFTNFVTPYFLVDTMRQRDKERQKTSGVIQVSVINDSNVTPIVNIPKVCNFLLTYYDLYNESDGNVIFVLCMFLFTLCSVIQ